MIYVTCGHEKGVGLEVFLKSYILLSSKEQKSFTLICDKESLLETCENIKLSYKYSNTNAITIASYDLQLILIKDKPISTSALNKALEVINQDDVLVTLPTSKDQLFFNEDNVAGHTEFFRKYFEKNVSMFFKSRDANVLLISDHVSLKQLPDYITPQLLEDQIRITIKDYLKYFGTLKKVFISGLNPHAGESGMLGKEEQTLGPFLNKLRKEFSDIEISDFLPADSMLINNSFSNDSLFIYMYHDQGLSPFKTLFKTHGANISLGLPFLRLSVDHGTAFDLYGKNTADYLGCLYVLQLAIRAQRI